MSADITTILNAIDDGDSHASETLLPLVYDELRKLADARLQRERPGQTLQATALVHEAYMRVAGPSNAKGWDSRGHFFAAAAEAMRRILVDRARARGAAKRGGSWRKLDADIASMAVDEVPAELVDLDEALTKLAETDPEKAKLVELRFFAGLSIEQAAAILEISTATATRYWRYARAWLYKSLEGTDPID